MIKILILVLLLSSCASTIPTCPTLPPKIIDNSCSFPPIQVSRTDTLETRQAAEAAWSTYDTRCKKKS